MQKPSIGRIVHYVSYGTPGGEYPSVCRAAIVTATHPDPANVFAIGLAVLTPSGMFFNSWVPQSEDDHAGGTWHWPERIEE